MDQGHAVGGVAAPTGTGLGDTAAVYLHLGRVGTYLALEEGLLHLGYQLGCPDDHAVDGDELVNVCEGTEVGLSAITLYTMCRGAGDSRGQW